MSDTILHSLCIFVNKYAENFALEASTNMENKEYKDNNGDKAIIPAGFEVSQVGGENRPASNRGYSWPSTDSYTTRI